MNPVSLWRQSPRRGVVMVHFAVLIILLLGMVAFAVDVGWITLVKNHLQVAADAAAHAGVSVMGDGPVAAKAKAREVAGLNVAGGPNDFVTLTDDQVALGFWDSATRTFTPNAATANAIRVRCERRQLPLFFAPVLGVRHVDVAAEAIAMVNPRDIAFVIDLSGSMNNDTEIWATNAINNAFPSYPTVGTDLMAAVFQDFGYGSYPGTVRHVGENYIPSSQWNDNAYTYLANTYLMNNLSVPSQYRTLSTDSNATRKTKTYRWIIDYQLAQIMPQATPAPNSSTNLAYWTDYLDYVIKPKSGLPPNQNSYRLNSASNPYPDAWPNLSSSVLDGFYNKLGYQTYVQFMMDYGRNKKAASNTTFVPLSKSSSLCPWNYDNNSSSPGYGFQFPPREQPTHAVRLAVMAAIDRIAQLNQGAAESLKDHVCVITFDTASGVSVKFALNRNGCDYHAVKQAVTDLQAVGDDVASTASENGLILARRHLDPQQNPDARSFASRVIIFLTDGIPNVKQSSSSSIDSYTQVHSGEWFTSGSYLYERNAVLMQTSLFAGERGKMFAVGVGLGADRTMMDRAARMANTAKPDPNNPYGPKISPYADGNPADYQQRLTAIFNEIVTSRGGSLVR